MATRKRSYITPPIDASSLKGEPISDDEPFEGAGLVYSGGEWKPAAGGAGGGASVSASYVTLGSEPGLTSERVLTAGTGIALVDNGANSTVVINVTGEAVGADWQASFVVMGNTSSLPNERALAVGTGIRMTDGGAGGNVTLAVNDSVIATISGSTFTGAITAPVVNAQVTGSITRTAAGTAFITSPANNVITITTGSNGQIILSGNVGATAAPFDAQYLTLTSDGTLTNERTFTPGTGLKAVDAGANSTYTLSVHDGTFAALSGANFTGPVNAQITGSLTRTAAGTPFITVGPNNIITIVTGANGQIIFSGSVPGDGTCAPNSAQYLTLAVNGFLGNERVFTPGGGLKAVDGGANGAYTLRVDDMTVAVVTGANTFQGDVTAVQGFSGSLTRLYDGRSYIAAGDNITIVSQSQGQIRISAVVGGGSGGDANATYLVLSATGSLNNERVITTGTGIKAVDAGAGGAYTLSVHDGTFAALSGANFTGPVSFAGNATFNGALTGSLTKLVNGKPFITALPGNIITVTTSSEGQIILSGTGGGAGGGGGAPTNADYLVLTADSTLTNERSLALGSGLKAVDAGANSTYTLRVHDGTFAALSGAQFTGPVSFASDVTFNGALTGSLTRLVGGTPFITVVPNNIITISTSSTGQVILSGNAGFGGGGSTVQAQYLVLQAEGALSDERVFTPGAGLKATDAGAGGTYTLSVHDGTFAALSGANFTGPVTATNAQITGSITVTAAGTPFITAPAGNVVTVTTGANGQVIISGSGGAGGAGGGPSISPNIIQNDAYGRLEFYLTSSLGGVGTVTAVPALRHTITHAHHLLFINSGSHQWLEPSTLTASMVVTCSTAGAVTRDHMSIYVMDTNYDFTVSNGGGALGTLFSSSIGGARRRAVWDIVYDGANWVLGSITRLG